jgi:protoporphyrinogen oxidase
MNVVDQTESPWDTIILGAGMSGLISASVLHRQRAARILIVDEYARIGGNHIDCSIGPYTFDIGSFLFQDDSPLIGHFPELLELYHPVVPCIQRVAPDGVVRSYPFSFSDEFVGAGPLEWLRTSASLLKARLTSAPITNAAEYAEYWLGSRLFQRSGLGNYIERFHGAKAGDIDKVFAEKRMNQIAHLASFRKQIAKLLGARAPRVSGKSFVRPHEGFARLYGVVAESLERKGTNFALGRTLSSITRSDTLFRVQAVDLDATSHRLVSTMPISRTLQLCGLPMPAPLPSAELISLFFSFSGSRRGFSANVLYNFSATGRWKRLTMFSDFYGKVYDREYFTVEANLAATGQQGEDYDIVGCLAADFRTDVLNKGLFTGTLTLVGSYRLQNAYPIYRKGAAEAASTAIQVLSGFGIESFGRQGGFDYLPNAGLVTREVEAKLDRVSR